MYLIDTDILSMLRRRDRNPGLVQWICNQRTEDMYLSVMSIGEIKSGIDRVLRRNQKFALELTDWLQRVLDQYGERILPVDIPIARRWGELCAKIGNNDTDLLIAATALERDFTVVTGNVKDFEPTGAKVINPSK